MIYESLQPYARVNEHAIGTTVSHNSGDAMAIFSLPAYHTANAKIFGTNSKAHLTKGLLPNACKNVGAWLHSNAKLQ